MSNLIQGIASVALSAVIIILTFGAWITHVVYTISAGAWLLLLVGAIVPPVGAIHGIMIWFGQPW